jgi:hypothetical protein
MTSYRLFLYKRGFTRDYNARLQKLLGVTAELRLLRGAVALKWQPYSLSHSTTKRTLSPITIKGSKHNAFV